MSELFHPSLPLWNLGTRAVVVFLAVLFLLRISGKRQLGQMSAVEFVALLLISNAVQNSMNGGDNSLSGGLWLAAVLIFMSWLFSFVTYKNKYLRKILEGSPTLLIHKGKVIDSAMHKERLTHNELTTLLRKQGIHHLHEVDCAILEPDATLIVLKSSKEQIKI